jgi:hypothetical protein
VLAGGGQAVESKPLLHSDDVIRGEKAGSVSNMADRGGGEGGVQFSLGNISEEPA